MTYELQVWLCRQRRIAKLPEPVIFYATTKDQEYSFTLEKKSTLVFERVVINIGSHYNNIDGIFVAPKRGIYLFAWTVCTNGANYFMTELMVDNTMISRAGENEKVVIMPVDQ
jgi:hypothetical protein